MKALIAFFARLFGLAKEQPKPDLKIVPPPSPELTPAPAPVTTPARVLGVDVAKYQDKLDAAEWRRLWDMRYRFAFVKATDGATGTDPYFKTHRANAHQRGFIVGAYLYFRFGHDPLVQARKLKEVVGNLQADELPPVIDVEWDRFTAGGKYGPDKRMDAAAVDMVWACVQEIEKFFGVKPIIYTNAYFWPERIERPERFQGLLLWVPSYSDSLNPRGVHLLQDLSPEELARAGAGVKVPHPWKAWTFWQDDDDLSVGDVKAIDTNVFRGSLEDLQALARR